MTKILKKAIVMLGVILISKVHRSKWISDALSVKLENFWAVARGESVRFKLMTRENILLVEEAGRQLQISNVHRGFWLYRNGIETRGRFLFHSYCLQNINFREDDIVFDCGANSGDLFLSLSRMIRAENYYAFEPNPSDFRVLCSNVSRESNIFNIGLGDIDSELIFYVSTEGGDSSFIEPMHWNEKIMVPVVRLDSFINKNHVNKIKLLKLEAEGFEPEILVGFGDKIELCEYIALDGGYERGKGSEQTLTICTNYLLSKGFHMLDIYFPWCRALYRRK
jgi:FkbM family methyltransferase